MLGYPDRRDKTTWDLEGPNGPNRVVVHGSMIGDGLGFVMGAVVAGAGIGLVPISRAKEVEAENLVVRVMPEYSTKGADFSVVVTSRQIPQRVTLLRDFLVQAPPDSPRRPQRHHREAGGRSRRRMSAPHSRAKRCDANVGAAGDRG